MKQSSIREGDDVGERGEPALTAVCGGGRMRGDKLPQHRAVWSTIGGREGRCGIGGDCERRSLVIIFEQWWQRLGKKGGRWVTRMMMMVQGEVVSLSLSSSLLSTPCPAVELPPSPVLPNETVGGVILSAEARTLCVALLG